MSENARNTRFSIPHRWWFLALAFLSLGTPVFAGEEHSPLVLFDFEKGFALDKVEARDVKIRLTEAPKGRALSLRTGHRIKWPGITLKPQNPPWDLSRHTHVALDVCNHGEKSVHVCCRADNPGADGVVRCVTEKIVLKAGESGVLSVPLIRSPWILEPPFSIVGMRGKPVDMRRKVNPACITAILVFVPLPKADHAFTIDNIRAEGKASSGEEKPKPFLPFIDPFGQYRHKTWPGKILRVEDFPARIREEAADLLRFPGPEEWNAYGGWRKGPALKATGFFRTAKVKGKWWLVDPRGRLFWSHGIDCVGFRNATTPITDRKVYFQDLPPRDSPLAPFYGKGSWAPHGYYKGKGRYETYNFTGANLFRKYGTAWRDRAKAVIHTRLRSWGLNTIGNWSDGKIRLDRQTPYVTSLSSAGPPIAGSTGYWRQFPDPFDPRFREGVQKRLEKEKGRAAGDPWCLGIFIDNELSWGKGTFLAACTLRSPAEQKAKIECVRFLRKKYRTLAALNAAWGTKHATWDALLHSRESPDPKRAAPDLKAFSSKIAEAYFRICREEVKRAAPQTLYLGARFAWVNDHVIRAAAKYCDVLSFNLYRYSIADFRLPEGVDKPVIVGEFHFGALDRGMFHTGLKAAKDQDDRAAKYKAYVQGALHHPLFVGTHWFQYGDQATTGRGDGENYQIGFVDVCDTPYPETIRAAREVGYGLYAFRTEDR
ncbi:MAG: beta-agarase [Planctomycetota bacterium]|jgi:hypothetical protein